MSELVHVVVAGPTLKKLTPAPTTSARAFAPVGVVPSRGGPFANTIGNTGVPFSTTVPFGSSVVAPAAAIPTHTSASTRATGQTSRFIANLTPWDVESPPSLLLHRIYNNGPRSVRSSSS